MKKNISIYTVVVFSFIFLFASFNNLKASSFKFKRKSINVYETFDLKKIINDSNSITNYSTSNNSIVSVNQAGVITGNSMGQANITATDNTGNTIICLVSVGYYVGIDISFENHVVNWSKIKNEGIDFVMFRSSYGWYDDNDANAGKDYNFQFDAQLLNNIKGASEFGIPFGIYHYSYARNATEAIMEAEYTINALKSTGSYANNISLPIAYDVEDSKYQGSLSKSQLTDIVIAYCTKIKQAGYTPMVYASKSWFTDHLDINRLNSLGYDFWCALWHYPPGTTPLQIGNTGIYPLIWQHTSKGSIEGANIDAGTVDMNIMYMKEKVKIDFVNDSNDIITTKIIDKGTNIQNLPTISKEGHYFKGWKDTNGNIINNTTTFSTNTTLTANFEKLIPLEKLSFNCSTKYILKNDSTDLNVIYTPENTNVDKSIIWTSTNENIATVNNGTVKGISRGTATITAKSKYNKNIISTMQIIVYEKLKGDVNNDTLIDISDAYLLLRKITSTDELELKPEDLPNGDFDENGIVDITDTYLLLRYIVNNM